MWLIGNNLMGSHNQMKGGEINKRLTYILMVLFVSLWLLSGTAAGATVTIRDDDPNGPNNPYGLGLHKG